MAQRPTPPRRPAAQQRQVQQRQAPAQGRASQRPAAGNRQAAPQRQQPQMRRPAAQQRKSNFVYRQESYEGVKARTEYSGRNFDTPFREGVPTFRAQNGSNVIRFMPIAGWDNTSNYFGYTIFTHRYIGAEGGSYICQERMAKEYPDAGFETGCPICAAALQAKADGDRELNKQLYAREEVLFWIIDRSDDEPKPKLYALHRRTEREINALRIGRNGNWLEVSNPDVGYDLSFNREQLGKDVTNVRYSSWQYDREPSPLHDDPELQDQLLADIEEHPLPEQILIYDNDYLNEVLYGTQTQGDAELDSQEQEVQEDAAPPRNRRRGRTQPQEEQQEDTNGGAYDHEADEAQQYADERGDDQGTEADAEGGETGDEVPWSDDQTEGTEEGTEGEYVDDGQQEEEETPPPRRAASRQQQRPAPRQVAARAPVNRRPARQPAAQDEYDETAETPRAQVRKPTQRKPVGNISPKTGRPNQQGRQQGLARQQFSRD